MPQHTKAHKLREPDTLRSNAMMLKLMVRFRMLWKVIIGYSVRLVIVCAIFVSSQLGVILKQATQTLKGA